MWFRGLQQLSIKHPKGCTKPKALSPKIEVWIWIGDQGYSHSEVCGWFRGLQQLVAGKFTSRARRRPENERFRGFSGSALGRREVSMKKTITLKLISFLLILCIYI